jgi:glyoxylase-like metal-dependent hydrolase (beta-lactamase superfamily II)
MFRLGPLGDPAVLSSYLIVDTKIALIDCGPRPVIDELLSLVRECGISPEQIDHLLLTHIHLDHAGGAGSFVKKCPSATAYIPERGYKYLLNPEILNASARPILGERIFYNWGACDPVPAERAASVKPHEKIALGKLEVEYLPAPGHAPHHNVLHVADLSTVLAADALGILDPKTRSIIPTTPPPSFNLDQALRDIQMVQDLNPQLVCLAHFGEVSPSRNYYENVTRTFVEWAEIVSTYVKENNLVAYDSDDHQRIFASLLERWPQYQDLSADLKEQVSRVDVGGLLNYFIKAKRS